MPDVSDKTIGRLSLYRRLLTNLQADGTAHVFSHQLAELANVTPAQVRRDLMVTGYSGSPSKGYCVADLLEAIAGFLDSAGPHKAALVGVGNLGRAVLAYFAGRRPNLQIVAAFDSDPYKVNRVIHGCRCHPADQIAHVLGEEGIQVAVLAVPAEQAQAVADRLVAAGIRGILNFAPTTLRVPPHVYVEGNDITMALEKVAYFAHT